MALHGEVKVNGRVVLRWSAVRKSGSTALDSVNRYACTVSEGEYAMPFTVHHRYGDGAAGLAAAVLARYHKLETSE